jgi:DHA2 family multidrug resistance protein
VLDAIIDVERPGTVELLAAQQAGLALMPGGFAIILCMPLVGYLLGHTDARRLLLFGLFMVSFSLFYMRSHFDLAIDFQTVAFARVIQAMGLAFLFVPINTAAYAFLPPGKNNQASGLINLARNVGGSVGISFVVTMLARRAQVHQANMMSRLNSGNPQLQGTIASTAHALMARGSSASEAHQQAYGLIANNLNRQATMLAYIDNFWILGIAVAAMIPFVFLMKKVKPGGPIAVH